MFPAAWLDAQITTQLQMQGPALSPVVMECMVLATWKKWGP